MEADRIKEIQGNIEMFLEGAIINRKRQEKKLKKAVKWEKELEFLKEWFKD